MSSIKFLAIWFMEVGMNLTLTMHKFWSYRVKIFEWLKKKVYFCRYTKRHVENNSTAHIKANHQISWTNTFYHTHGGWDNRCIKSREGSVLLWPCIKLGMRDTLKKWKIMKDALDITHEITKLIKKTPGVLKRSNQNWLQIHQMLGFWDRQFEPKHCKLF